MDRTFAPVSSTILLSCASLFSSRCPTILQQMTPSMSRKMTRDMPCVPLKGTDGSWLLPRPLAARQRVRQCLVCYLYEYFIAHWLESRVKYSKDVT